MKTTTVDEGYRTFIAGGAIARDLRVTLSSGKLAVAGATAKELGTIWEPTYNDGDAVSVVLSNKQGTCRMVASGAITAGAVVYTAAAGKISATQATGAFEVGIALTAAAGDGSVIEVLRIAHGDTAGS